MAVHASVIRHVAHDGFRTNFQEISLANVHDKWLRFHACDFLMPKCMSAGKPPLALILGSYAAFDDHARLQSFYLARGTLE